MTQDESQQSPELESPREFAHVDDGFERLWTPHRMAYINGERPTDHAGAGCPFCSVVAKDDAEGLIVHRGRTGYVVMNLFPYNPGHVLVCPYRHVSLYVDLTVASSHAIVTIVSAAYALNKPLHIGLSGARPGDVAWVELSRPSLPRDL